MMLALYPTAIPSHATFVSGVPQPRHQPLHQHAASTSPNLATCNSTTRYLLRPSPAASFNGILTKYRSRRDRIWVVLTPEPT